MNRIELHILQSFPVSCLNRNDLGSPKSATFGGIQRARISSQCLKRSARTLAKQESTHFNGFRSRLILEPLTRALLAAGRTETQANKDAATLCDIFSKSDSDHPEQVKTAIYLSPAEIEQIAKAIAAGEDPKKAVRNVHRNDAADIALFGRMIANDPNLNVDGAAMFSHALSTHAVSNDLDFFSSVDDLKMNSEDAGAGMIGNLEFNSATYYRYAAINISQLQNPNNLGNLLPSERQIILKDFLKAVLLSVPNARANSMNAATLPFEVLGVRSSKGQPLQLTNAFEAPVRPSNKGFQVSSLEAMKTHLENIEKIWGSLGDKFWLTETGLDSFLNHLVSGEL